MSTNKCKQPLSTEEMESKAEELNRLVDSLEKGREEHRALMAEMEAREKLQPLSLQFVNAVKQLCKDFSDRQDRPYMGDVYSALDALLEHEQIPIESSDQSKSDSLRRALEQTYLALIGYLPAHRNDVTGAAIEAARAALGYTEEPFPSPKRQSKPCGECHLQDGERCDICGAKATQ